MTTRHHTKLVHEGQYVAEVDVELIQMDTGWSPYLALEDAYRLDDVRDAFWGTKYGCENFRVSISMDNLFTFLSTVGATLADLRSR